jgi:hypothetical protein
MYDNNDLAAALEAANQAAALQATLNATYAAGYSSWQMGNASGTVWGPCPTWQGNLCSQVTGGSY